MTDTWQMNHIAYDGTALGEIVNAHDRNFNFALNQPQTISFNIDITNPMVTQIIENRLSSSMITLSRRADDAAPGVDGDLEMTAEIQSMSLVGSKDAKSLAVVAVETMWPRIMARLIRKSLNETLGFAGDKGKFVHKVLEELNAAHPSTITVGSWKESSNMVIDNGAFFFEQFGGVINQLALTTEGFDFWQEPQKPVTATSETGKLNIAQFRGSQLPNIVFEYGAGTRANVTDYNFSHDRSNLANDVTVQQPNSHPSPAIALAAAPHAEDAASIAKWLYRDALSPTTLTDKTLATQLAEDTVALRAEPLETFTFQPTIADEPTGAHRRTPVFLDDFDIGDVIHGPVDDYGITLLDALVRVYGVTVSLDDNGLATHKLTLSLNTT